MSVDEDTMRTALVDNNNRRIVRFCKSPHTSTEIVEYITPSRDSDRSYYETIVSNSLRILENYGMITFSEGRWTSSVAASSVLQKYFGG